MNQTSSQPAVSKAQKSRNSVALPFLSVQSSWLPVLLTGLLIGLTGCEVFPKAEAEAQPKRPGAGREGKPTPVDVAIARTGALRQDTEYTGTTIPLREVSVRSQAEGKLLNLYTDQGNTVTRGQLLARLDDTLLQTAVTQAEAELASRESEVARARTLVSNARTQVEQARLEQQQTQNDAARFQKLLSAGAVSQQQAELSQTAAGTAAQAVRAAQEQVRTEQQAVAAAESRVIAQRAVVAQARERRSYALVTAPITGIVLEKFTEPGNLVSAGSEVLKIGDFSRAKVVVQVSELEVSKIRVGQSVQVRLDAFPQTELTGQVTHISPSADPTARILPIEITIPNTNGRIGSGLLARVRFSQQSNQRVIVPQTALRAGETRGREGQGQSQREGQTTANKQAKLFVVLGDGQNAKVAAKQVTLGDRANNQVEVLSGLQPGERLVIRSGKPLKDGETVRLSVLSESSSNRQNQQSKTQKPE